MLNGCSTAVILVSYESISKLCMIYYTRFFSSSKELVVVRCALTLHVWFLGYPLQNILFYIN